MPVHLGASVSRYHANAPDELDRTDRAMAEYRSTPVEGNEHHQPNDQCAFCESYT
jgi:hypothetical protein